MSRAADSRYLRETTVDEIEARNAKTREAWRKPIAANSVEAADHTRTFDQGFAQQTPAPAPSKHGNQKTLIAEGEVVDSKKEARRRKELRLAGRGGFITELAFQVEFYLGIHKDDEGHEHVCKYIADAVYVDAKGVKHVEDTKSAHTRTLPVYRLKKRLMKALLGLEIEEA